MKVLCGPCSVLALFVVEHSLLLSLSASLSVWYFLLLIAGNSEALPAVTKASASGENRFRRKEECGELSMLAVSIIGALRLERLLGGERARHGRDYPLA